MATDYLEIKKANDCQTRTLVRMCHNYKNITLVKETFDDKTGLWRSENSFILPIKFIKPISDYTKQHDIFQLTRTPEKNSVLAESPYSPRYYGCITPIKLKRGSDVKTLSKRTRKLFADYDNDCIEIWENQLGQLEEVEQISEFWAFDQSQPDPETIKTPEKQLPLLSNKFSDDLDLDETPPSCLCYAPAKKLKLSQF